MARVRNRKRAYRVSVGRPGGKRPLGKHRLRWQDNIKMDLHGVGWGVMDRIGWLSKGTGGGLL